MINTSTYNYDRFKSGLYDFEVFEGPNAGDRYQDAELYTLDGHSVCLSDFLKDKPLVLETGSMTCPMYGNSVPPMQKLAAKYPELDFVVMYVREAHPGERVPAHQTRDDKIEAARKSREHHKDKRITLVDDVDGSAHKVYGAMPNSIYVIDTDGTVVFRSIWNNAEDMESILGTIARREQVSSRDLKPKPPFNLDAIRTLLAGGWVALYDFVVSLTGLIIKHRKRGNM